MRQIELMGLSNGDRVREIVSQVLGSVIEKRNNAARVRFDDGRTKWCSAGDIEAAPKDDPGPPVEAPEPRGLGVARLLLELCAKRWPPPPECSHSLILKEGAMWLTLNLGGDRKFFSFMMGEGALDMSSDQLFSEIEALLPDALVRAASGQS